MLTNRENLSWDALDWDLQVPIKRKYSETEVTTVRSEVNQRGLTTIIKLDY